MGESDHLIPEVAWQAFIAARDEGDPGALETLRPWLVANAALLIHDPQMAALVAQQVMVDLSSRAGQAIRSPEELEQWLKVRLTQTASLFTGGLWEGSQETPPIASSIPSALALGAGWYWTRQLASRVARAVPSPVLASVTAALALGLVAFAMTSSFSFRPHNQPQPKSPPSLTAPGGVPHVISPLSLPSPPTPPSTPPATSVLSQAKAPPAKSKPTASTPTPTPTISPHPTPTPTKSPHPTPTPTISPHPTPTPTRSPHPTPTPTKTPCPTPTIS
ncbi:MAG: hypothetical protein WB801_05005, partial [Candidatus Dormiibacterota bacterium]